MKKPQPDLGTLTLGSYVSNVGGVRKLKRLWGTQTVNSVEVLTPRQYYHPVSSRQGYVSDPIPKEFEKVMRYLGVYNDIVNGQTEGLKSAWLYLNKNKLNDDLVDADGFVSDNLGLVFWDPADGAQPTGITLTTNIVIGRELGTPPELSGFIREVPTTNLLNTGMTEAQLITAVETNYETLFNTCLITQEGPGVVGTTENDAVDLFPDDPWLDIMSRYALRTDGITSTITGVEIGVGEVHTTYTSGGGDDAETEKQKLLYPTYVVTVEIPARTFSPLIPFVQSIVTDIEKFYPRKWASRKFLTDDNGFYSQRTVRGFTNADLATDPDLVYRPYDIYEDSTTAGDVRFQNIWMNYNGSWYLRADALDSPRTYNLTFRELAAYLFPILDTGYSKKKAKWWKKALAIIIFIIIVVVSAVSGQWQNMAIAKGVLLAGLTLTLFSLAFSAVGMEDWAMAFAEASKTVEPLVTVAAIVVMVDGLRLAAEEAAKAAGEEALTAEVAGELIVNKANEMVDQIIKGAKDVLSGNFTSNASLKFITGSVKLSTIPSKNKLKDINSRNKDTKAEYDKIMEELTQESDVLKGFANIYAKPATADWSIYAEVFDLPYERGGGNLALGNVQRTTKQALRKGNYSDPAFENILVV